MTTTRRLIGAAARRTGLRTVPGHFDGLVGRNLAGWVRNGSAPPSATLIFGDEVVGRVRAAAERKDVSVAGEDGTGFGIAVSKLDQLLEALENQDDEPRSLRVVDDAGVTLPVAGEPIGPGQLRLLLALGLAVNVLGASVEGAD